MEIKEVTLLSAEEYEAYKEYIKPISNWWWLRTPAQYSFGALVVFPISGVDRSGLDVYTGDVSVRPALRVNLESKLKTGEKVEIAGHAWTAISTELLLCDQEIGKYSFRWNRSVDDANNFQNSDIRKYLNTWAHEKGIIQEINPEYSIELLTAICNINRYTMEEFGTTEDFGKPAIDDVEKAKKTGALRNIGIAYTTVEREPSQQQEYEIQVTADLENYRILKEIDGILVGEEQYDSLRSMNENALQNLDFDDLITVSDEEWETYKKGIYVTVSEARLLTADEYEKYKEHIKPFYNDWWLQTPADDSKRASIAINDGSVDREGLNVDNLGVSVRPVLILDREDSIDLNPVEPSQIVRIGETYWTAISGDMLLSERSIAEHPFNMDWRFGNDYKGSGVKLFVDNWAARKGLLGRTVAYKTDTGPEEHIRQITPHKDMKTSNKKKKHKER